MHYSGQKLKQVLVKQQKRIEVETSIFILDFNEFITVKVSGNGTKHKVGMIFQISYMKNIKCKVSVCQNIIPFKCKQEE